MVYEVKTGLQVPVVCRYDLNADGIDLLEVFLIQPGWRPADLTQAINEEQRAELINECARHWQKIKEDVCDVT